MTIDWAGFHLLSGRVSGWTFEVWAYYFIVVAGIPFGPLFGLEVVLKLLDCFIAGRIGLPPCISGQLLVLNFLG